MEARAGKRFSIEWYVVLRLLDLPSTHCSQTVQFCANNLKNITGRVLVQVSPSRVYDTEKVLEQCYAYDRAFAEAGVPRDRYAIKLSTTGPAMVAAEKLNKEGIRTLGTSLFSLPQAIAASQAGCLFISPYFNEVAAYSDDSLMHKGTDPAMTVCLP